MRRTVIGFAVGIVLIFVACNQPPEGDQADVSLEARATSIYGPGLGFDDLANTQIGGVNNEVISYRIRSDYTATLSSLRVYLMWGTGYSGGTGGKLQVSVQGNDLTNFPDGKTLASATIQTSPNKSNFPVIKLSKAVGLEKGKIYHFVFTNPDSSPLQNFVSLNSLIYSSLDSPRQPSLVDGDWDVLLSVSPSATKNLPGTQWVVRDLSKQKVYTPIIDMAFTNGSHQGIGYMEVWARNPKPISGVNQVRQNFTLQGQTLKTSEINVRLRRVSGLDPLEVRLESATGLLEGALVDATSISSDKPGWVKVYLKNTYTLEQGKTYYLVLTAPSTSGYEAFPIRQGSDYGFTPNTFYNDGYAQFNNGSGWIGWDQWGGVDDRTGDLQFYLKTQVQ